MSDIQGICGPQICWAVEKSNCIFQQKHVTKRCPIMTNETIDHYQLNRSVSRCWFLIQKLSDAICCSSTNFFSWVAQTAFSEPTRYLLSLFQFLLFYWSGHTLRNTNLPAWTSWSPHILLWLYLRAPSEGVHIACRPVLKWTAAVLFLWVKRLQGMSL